VFDKRVIGIGHHQQWNDYLPRYRDPSVPVQQDLSREERRGVSFAPPVDWRTHRLVRTSDFPEVECKIASPAQKLRGGAAS
jgi:hypothetical protein